MNILLYLFENFITEEKGSIIILFVLSLLNSLVQSTMVSFIVANLIESIENKNILLTMKCFYQFIGISVIFLIFYYLYKILQNTILTKMTQWIKK